MGMTKVFTSKVIILAVTSIALLNCILLYNRSLYSLGSTKPDNEVKIEITPKPEAFKNIFVPTTKVLETRRISSHTTKISRNSYNTTSSVDTKRVRYILLINTLGRSGSSWVGELLSQQDKYFYIYEPDFYLANYIKEEINSTSGPQMIKSQFHCSFTDGFVTWTREVRKKSPSNIFRSKFTISCKKNVDCLWPDKIKKNCESSTVRIIKMIRLRVSYVETLLKDPVFNTLKVIYLVRDPRASLISRNHLGWEADPVKICKVKDEDLEDYKVLHRLYPEQTHLLRYEDLCINTKEEATKLWQFLMDTANPMPIEWRKFLKIHSKTSRRKKLSFWDYGIDRDTKTEWTNWRNEISNSTLFYSIEKHCGSNIDQLGYTRFGSMKKLRDLSIFGLRSHEECPSIPCGG